MSWARIAGPAYWIGFVALFFLVAIAESLRPLRELSSPTERRWRNHLAILAIAVAILALFQRMSPVVLAAAVEHCRWGVLNKPWLPLAVRCGVAIVLLDLLQYWIHWSFHHFPWLWRVHEVHHSDPDYDVSTAGRFHPLEVLYSQGIRFGAIALLAPPAAAVFIAELLTMILNLTVHANASLPERIETPLRALFITPDLHRIHHSQDVEEQNRNLGQTFPWWDRLFGTYTPKARANGEAFRTGIRGLEKRDQVGIGFMLAEPFRNLRRENPESRPDPLTQVDS
jgi:sterol desaturase/sphingolipid hydroxylase (fatty acid hydroxylase superfamily)